MATAVQDKRSKGELKEAAKETAQVEQYSIRADRSKPRKPPKDYNYIFARALSW
jgi:hypothetical protein